MIKEDGIPQYLRKDWAEKRWKRIIKVRVENEIKESWYWEGEEGRKCRIYEREEETWEHLWEVCV